MSESSEMYFNAGDAKVEAPPRAQFLSHSELEGDVSSDYRILQKAVMGGPENAAGRKTCTGKTL